LLHGKLLVARSTQHHVHMKTEAWAQDAAANHALGSCLPSSVGELGAGAGAGDAAVHSPGLYKGGPMTDEHDRLAICAIIQHHMPKSLTVTKIAQLAVISRDLSLEYCVPEEVQNVQGRGGAWLEVHGGDSGKERQTIRAGVIAS
jgi:hypothetical protein